jgi:hypothetical protein
MAVTVHHIEGHPWGMLIVEFPTVHGWGIVIACFEYDRMVTVPAEPRDRWKLRRTLFVRDAPAALIDLHIQCIRGSTFHTPEYLMTSRECQYYSRKHYRIVL